MTRRLLLSYVSLTVLVLLLLEVPLGISFARAERRQLESDVQHDAFALALRSEEVIEEIQDQAADPSAEQLDFLAQLATDYVDEQGGRLVLVDDQGIALADGDPPSRQQAIGRDFSSRPEIARALRGLEATGDRHSVTLGYDLLYVAVPVASGGVVHGALRVTYPLSVVDERIRDNWLVLAAVAGVILLIVFGVSIFLARSIARPLATLEQGANALGRGELGTRVPVPARPHELATLSRSFNSTAAQLEQLMKSQEAFVADASHQLRSPLAALRLRLENLDRVVDARGREDVEGALSEVNRLSLLVDGLLELARIDGNAPAPEVVHVGALLDDRREAWSALAEERGVRLVVRHHDERVLATRGRLEQVLDNLLNNALEVAPARSAITMTTERRESRVLIQVVDEGPGMDEGARERAFDRFWRAGDGSGFGLGLAIVRQLVRSEGGDVTLAAGPAGGLAVEIELPSADSLP